MNGEVPGSMRGSGGGRGPGVGLPFPIRIDGGPLVRGPGRRCLWVLPPVLAALVGMLSVARPAMAHAAGWGNPFAPDAAGQAGLLAVALHQGSGLRDGVGASLAVQPWGALGLELGHGYRTMHALSAQLRWNVLPRAQLTPYLPLGYTLSISPLPYDITLHKHELYAGLGLRLLERTFMALEATGAHTFHQTLDKSGETQPLEITEPWSFRTGVSLAVYLL